MTDVVIDTLSLEKFKQPQADALNELGAQAEPPTKPLDFRRLAHIVGTHRIFVAMHEKRMVGKVTMIVYRCEEGYIACIRGLVVATDMRRQKIATKLIERCRKEAEAIGITSLELAFNPSSKSMRHLATSQRFGWSSTYVASRPPVKAPPVPQEA